MAKQLIFLDTETLGLCGPCALIQYAEGIGGKVQFIEPITDPNGPQKVKDLEKKLDNRDIVLVAYNAPFDLGVLYRTFKRTYRLACDVIDLQIKAKQHHPLGPFSFQGKKTGERAIASLKGIHVSVVSELASYLEKKLQKRVPKLVTCKAHIHEIKDQPDFKNISFSLHVSFKLKTLMQYLGHRVQKIKDVWPLPKGEDQSNPFPQPCHTEIFEDCWAILQDKTSNFWKYAEDDVKYLQELYLYLEEPESDYNDEAAHVVAYTYYYGFPLDHSLLKQLQKECKEKMKLADTLPIDIQSSKQRLEYFSNRHPKRKLKNCDKYVLEKLAQKGDEHAKLLMDYGETKQMFDQCEKLLSTSDGRGHPLLNVMGTATQRMSGTGGFNWQGIAKGSKLREAILTSCGGDFSGLEIGLMALIYESPSMQKELDQGKDIHLATAVDIHPKLKGKYTYEEAASIRKDETHDKHSFIDKCRGETKGVVFGSAYGAMAKKIAETLGISEELAEQLLDAFYSKYFEIRDFKQRLEEEFCTGDTELWTQNSVGKMKSEITDWLGFTRHWDFEASTADFFWRQANKVGLEEMSKIFLTAPCEKIIRKETKGPQTVQNTVRSALLGAALTIQSSVARVATNSIVQSTGAQLTKRLKAFLWKKHGIPMLNVHDEIIVPQDHPNADPVAISKSVQEWIQKWKPMFRYLDMDFRAIKNWSER